MKHKKVLYPAPKRTEEEMKGNARHMLRAEMAKRGLNFRDLTEALAHMGVDYDERSLSNKIARGSFSAAFLLQCAWAMNIAYVETGFSISEIEIGSDEEGVDLDEAYRLGED